MGISLMHHFHPKSSTVQNISPSRNYSVLTINQRLIEVETVEIECHRGNTKSGEPDTNDGPGSKEEVQRTGVIERSILENKASKVTVSGNNVISLFFLTELEIGRAHV